AVERVFARAGARLALARKRLTRPSEAPQTRLTLFVADADSSRFDPRNAHTDARVTLGIAAPARAFGGKRAGTSVGDRSAERSAARVGQDRVPVGDRGAAVRELCWIDVHASGLHRRLEVQKERP